MKVAPFHERFHQVSALRDSPGRNQQRDKQQADAA